MTAKDKVLVGSRKPLAGRRVLILEDEYFLADEIAGELTALGAEIVGPFGGIADADAALKSGTRIDMAVLDVQVRNEMVFPLARALRSRGVPFVFTTGYGRASLDAEFQDVELWQKPLDLARVLPSLPGLISQGTSE